MSLIREPNTKPAQTDTEIWVMRGIFLCLSKFDSALKNQPTIFFKVNTISEFGDSLALSIYSVSDNHIGIYPGDLVKPIDFDDAIGQSRKMLNTSKYTLLDFWGTWCGPCVAGLPKLREFYQKHKDKIELISVAHDKETKILRK